VNFSGLKATCYEGNAFLDLVGVRVAALEIVPDQVLERRAWKHVTRPIIEQVGVT
jgi:hypothetical protein